MECLVRVPVCGLFACDVVSCNTAAHELEIDEPEVPSIDELAYLYPKGGTDLLVNSHVLNAVVTVRTLFQNPWCCAPEECMRAPFALLRNILLDSEWTFARAMLVLLRDALDVTSAAPGAL